MTRVAIVGGGVSGLAAAYFLARRGVASRLFEQQAHLGGAVRSANVGGCRVEVGADSWLAEKRWMLRLVRELGLGDQVLGSNDSLRRTYVVRKGRCVALPDSMRLLAPSKPWQVLTTPLLGPRSKARMALEWFRRPSRSEDRSVAAFVEDHFGREAVEYLAQPLVAGVYGSSPEALSAQSVLPRFVGYEQRTGSILRATFADRHRRPGGPLFLTLRDGMGSLVESLAQHVAGNCHIVHGRVESLERRGGTWTVHLGGAMYRADSVVLAVPAREAARLVEGAAPELAGLLGRIRYTSTVVASLVYPRKGLGHPLNGFGLLVPRAERGTLAACTWASTKFDGRAPPDRAVLRAFLTGKQAKRAASLSAGDLISRTHAELQRWMGLKAAPRAGRVDRLPDSMPCYGVGHADLLRRIREGVRPLAGLHLSGNGYDGLGIPDCVRRSERIAETIAADRRPLSPRVAGATAPPSARP